MTLRGKGKSYADDVSISLFSDLDDADKFCIEHTSKGKYWEASQIVRLDYAMDTSYPFED